MKKAETTRFNELYLGHLRSLKLQGKSQKTIDAYARAVRRIGEHFDSINALINTLHVDLRRI